MGPLTAFQNINMVDLKPNSKSNKKLEVIFQFPYMIIYSMIQQGLLGTPMSKRKDPPKHYRTKWTFLYRPFLQPNGLQPTRLLCTWGFSRQEYWSGLPFPSPGDLPNPGIEPGCLIAGRFFTTRVAYSLKISLIHDSLHLPTMQHSDSLIPPVRWLFEDRSYPLSLVLKYLAHNWYPGCWSKNRFTVLNKDHDGCRKIRTSSFSLEFALKGRMELSPRKSESEPSGLLQLLSLKFLFIFLFIVDFLSIYLLYRLCSSVKCLK